LRSATSCESPRPSRRGMCSFRSPGGIGPCRGPWGPKSPVESSAKHCVSGLMIMQIPSLHGQIPGESPSGNAAHASAYRTLGGVLLWQKVSVLIFAFCGCAHHLEVVVAAVGLRVDWMHKGGRVLVLHQPLTHLDVVIRPFPNRWSVPVHADRGVRI
jgi:hypothetical protein